MPTKPFDGQKTGTSGLRKKTEVFTQEHYLANWYVAAQGLLAALRTATIKGTVSRSYYV